ncbi:hypothetical protein BGZ49_000570 [Haplosporangium sp. Z 27]|nr:hypothetical protein BGZ49_000570 [Haplosporangium sp. Z 27]
MFKPQEIDSFIQQSTTAPDKALAEILEEMDSWEPLFDSSLATASNTTATATATTNLNFAVQDDHDLTPFQILHNQVQFENDFGIDNPNSRFALDLVSPFPTPLPTPVNIIDDPIINFLSYPKVDQQSSQDFSPPILPSQTSDILHQIPYPDPCSIWNLSLPPWQPSPLDQPHIQPTDYSTCQDPILSASLLTPYPISTPITEIKAPQECYFYNNNGSYPLEYSAIGADTYTKSLLRETEAVSSTMDLSKKTETGVGFDFLQPSWSPYSPSSSSSSSSSFSTLSLSSPSCYYSTSILPPSPSPSTASHSSSSKPTVSSKPVRKTPYPLKFYIMEPYKHTTAKVDRRSFNSCKELKQARARASESRYRNDI